MQTLSGLAGERPANRAGKWSGVLVQLLVGILYLAAGFVVSERPLISILVLTVFLALSFIVLGAFRALAALMIRFSQWGWALLNGVITMLAGIVIYRQLPIDALWVVGLLVGLEMLFNGWTWIMLATEIDQQYSSRSPPATKSRRKSPADPAGRAALGQRA